METFELSINFAEKLNDIIYSANVIRTRIGNNGRVIDSEDLDYISGELYELSDLVSGLESELEGAFDALGS